MGCGSERNNQQPLCPLPLGPWRQVANCVSTKSHPCPSAPCLVQAPRPPLPYADTTEDGGTKRHKVVETMRSSARRKVNLSDGQQELPLPPLPLHQAVELHFHIPGHKLQTPVFNFHREHRFHFQAAKLPRSWPLLCQKRTVADWHIELLIICCMRYRCCINEQYSITVS